MKRFKYSLENVLHYKEQILDSITAEHGTLFVFMACISVKWKIRSGKNRNS